MGFSVAENLTPLAQGFAMSRRGRPHLIAWQPSGRGARLVLNETVEGSLVVQMPEGWRLTPTAAANTEVVLDSWLQRGPKDARKLSSVGASLSLRDKSPSRWHPRLFDPARFGWRRFRKAASQRKPVTDAQPLLVGGCIGVRVPGKRRRGRIAGGRGGCW